MWQESLLCAALMMRCAASSAQTCSDLQLARFLSQRSNSDKLRSSPRISAEPKKMLIRLTWLLLSRALPLAVLALAAPQLHRFDVIIALIGFTTWMLAEALAEDPHANQTARKSEQDHGSRMVILSAH